METQDFIRGIDFTTLPDNLAAGGDHNSLVDLTEPNTDRGLVITTTDSALDTPVVPDPTQIGVTKGKRYLWNRLPFNTGGDTSHTIPKLYAWNELQTEDLGVSSWQLISVDANEIQSIVNAATAAAAIATTTANTAISTANAASTLASTANTTANNALTTANSGVTNAANAQATANTANANAGAAQTSATAALSAANANIPVTRLTPGNVAGMMYRAKSDNTGMELFSPLNNYVCLTEEYVVNTGPGDSLTFNVRQLNTERADTGNLVSLAAGIITIAPGVYKVKATVPGYSTTVYKHVAWFIRGTGIAGAVLITGTAASGDVGITTHSFLEGYITVDAGSTSFCIGHVFGAGEVTGLGKPVNLTLNEVFTVLELWKIG